MADTTNRLAGVAYLSVDGQSYMLAGEVSYSVSRVKRTTLSGPSGVQGYSEEPIPGSISGSFRDAGGLTVAKFNAMTNNTVTVELANGKTIIGRNMWTVDSQEVKSGEATFDVKWEGPTVEEA
ncbi:phage tail tube protein [Janthinobacterium sp.]|uniref:phage tail tube protein n=1 Tax=Janthinobacterium sp. TaxID=1871054 RepID=UPI00293D9AAF|nr:phage tail tube protein [Janthinobacterium sp.]